MKKYKITILVCLVLVISLLIVLVVVSSMDKGNASLPTWEQNPKDYTIAKSSIGTITKTVKCEGKASVDYSHFEVYTFTEKDNDNLMVKIDDILFPGDQFFTDEDITNKYLGRVENIIIEETSIQIVVSNFEYLQCELEVPQEKAYDIVVGQKAEIAYNDRLFEGVVREKAYVMSDDGFLNIVVEIEKNDIIIVNSSIVVDIILLLKEGVLRIPSEALITENGSCFVDVLGADGNIQRKEVVIGIKGNDYIEIKSGLTQGETVILNSYE